MLITQNDKTATKVALHQRFYTLPVLPLLFLGLADTTYLAWSHYKNYTDLTFSSFCALSKAINCDTVSQSPWSIFFGLPLAYWGFFAYALYMLLFLATFKKQNTSSPLWHLLCLLGSGYSGAAIAFGFLSALKIKAYCILCLMSYAISFALFFYSWIITRRFSPQPFFAGLKIGVQHIFSSWVLKLGIFVLLLLFICLKLFLPQYWHYEVPPLSENMPHGITEEGHPWIGAEQAEITIHEYADYQCFQCGKMHLFLRQLIAQHPGRIKLIHHHYPMDHEFNNIVVPEPFHIGSGKMAMIAIYATSKNKFWEMNDALFAMGRQKEPFNTKTLAAMTGFTSGELAAAARHEPIKEYLLHDIRQGMKLHITGTPTFMIDDQVYAGSLPTDILSRITQ